MELKAKMIAQGRAIVDLGAGDADFAPPAVAVETLASAAADPRMSRYAFQTGSIELRQAIASYMKRRFDVLVDPQEEVLPLIGSKEGLAHLALAVLEEGDCCVVPEPGYPPYAGGAVLAGAELLRCPLEREHGFLVEIDNLPPADWRRARLIYLNYPNNPTAATAPRDYLERVVARCRSNETLLAYDNPYVEITFDGYRAPSILEIPGAREVAVEFHSFSKSFGMTGWRLGWVVGNRSAIRELARIKTYVDTGGFLAVQVAGARVLGQAEELIIPVRDGIQQRRDVLLAALRRHGIEVETPRAAMYLWLELPRSIESMNLAKRLLEDHGVVALPGSTFGDAGEGYLRLALTRDADQLVYAAAAVAESLAAEGAAV